MASLLTQRSLRSATLRLPPEVRLNVFQSRFFSSTPFRKLSLLDVALVGPNAVLDGIHSLGVPWWATLPLTAVLVRGTFVYYFASLPARKKAHTKALLLPLITARADIVMSSKHEERRKIMNLENGILSKNLLFGWMRFKAQREATHYIGKPFGTPNFSSRGLLNFGMLIAFTEAIRLKCGTQDGLLPLILTPFQWLAEKLDPDRFPKSVEPKVTEQTSDSATVFAERIWTSMQEKDAAAMPPPESMPGASQASGILNNPGFQNGTVNIPPSSGLDTPGVYFDLSMTAEGLAWFTDLTLPDTTILFPAALGATFLVNTLLRPKVDGRPLANGRVEPDRSSEGQSAEENLSTTSTHLENGSDAHTAVPQQKFVLAELWEESRKTPEKAENMAKERGERAAQVTTAYFSELDVWKRFGIMMSMVFFVASMKMPVAVLLYFIPSMGLGWLQGRWLDLKYPTPQPIRRCERPMWRKARREWIDNRG